MTSTQIVQFSTPPPLPLSICVRNSSTSLIFDVLFQMSCFVFSRGFYSKQENTRDIFMGDPFQICEVETRQATGQENTVLPLISAGPQISAVL